MHALDLLPESTTSLLDIGCNDGALLLHAARLGVGRLRGVDINPAAVTTASQALGQLPDASATHASGDELPFAASSFDVVTCLEVLEHMPAGLRPGAVREMWRVLKPGGRLILSVPFAGLSGLLDPENMRFRFPGVYRAVNGLVGGRGKDQGYVGQKHGVVFHHHFAFKELQQTLAPHFDIDRVRGRGLLLFPLGAWVRWPFYRRQRRDHPVCKLAEWAMNAEMSLAVPKVLAFNLLLRAKRRDE